MEFLVSTAIHEPFFDHTGKRLRRYTTVHLKYTSPADGQVHDGVLIPLGRKATQAERLRPGDHWEILAHDNNPQDIKAE